MPLEGFTGVPERMQPSNLPTTSSDPLTISIRALAAELRAGLREADEFTRAYQCIDQEEVDDWVQMREKVEAALKALDRLDALAPQETPDRSDY